MSLRHALLSLLTAAPMTGYDASRAFGTSVGALWSALDSQIYPELRRMQADGLLEARPVPWGTRGATKTEYWVTEEGVQELARWQADGQTYPPLRDAARLKAAYFEFGDATTARRHLERHREHHEVLRERILDVIEQVRTGQHPTLRRRLERLGGAEREEIIRYKVFAHEGTLAQAEQEIAWAERGLAMLDQAPVVTEPAASPAAER